MVNFINYVLSLLKLNIYTYYDKILQIVSLKKRGVIWNIS